MSRVFEIEVPSHCIIDAARVRECLTSNFHFYTGLHVFVREITSEQETEDLLPCAKRRLPGNDRPYQLGDESWR